MKKFVIDPGVALRIVEEHVEPMPEQTLLAPSLLRSQVLDTLYRRVQAGELSESDGKALNARFARLKIRYLGDAVLRQRAWELAARAGMRSTLEAEYLALTQLQADALVTESRELMAYSKGLVTVLPFKALIRA